MHDSLSLLYQLSLYRTAFKGVSKLFVNIVSGAHLAALEAAQVLQLVGPRAQPHRPQQLRLDRGQLVRAPAVAAAPLVLLCSSRPPSFKTVPPTRDKQYWVAKETMSLRLFLTSIFRHDAMKNSYSGRHACAMYASAWRMPWVHSIAHNRHMQYGRLDGWLAWRAGSRQRSRSVQSLQ